MKVLIPLLSKQEDSPEFVEKSTKGAVEVYLLLVINPADLAGEFGFAAHEISKGNKMMGLVTELIGPEKAVHQIVEWGDTVSKIDNFYKLKAIDEIRVKKQDNYWFEDIVKKLKEKDLKVKII